MKVIEGTQLTLEEISRIQMAADELREPGPNAPAIREQLLDLLDRIAPAVQKALSP